MTFLKQVQHFHQIGPKWSLSISDFMLRCLNSRNRSQNGIHKWGHPKLPANFENSKYHLLAANLKEGGIASSEGALALKRFTDTVAKLANATVAVGGVSRDLSCGDFPNDKKEREGKALKQKSCLGKSPRQDVICPALY